VPRTAARLSRTPPHECDATITSATHAVKYALGRAFAFGRSHRTLPGQVDIERKSAKPKRCDVDNVIGPHTPRATTKRCEHRTRQQNEQAGTQHSEQEPQAALRPVTSNSDEKRATRNAHTTS
jgi:hypothetical protein